MVESDLSGNLFFKRLKEHSRLSGDGQFAVGFKELHVIVTRKSIAF